MKKTIFCIAAFVAMLMTPAAHVFASELNFAAKAQMPDNQVNKGVSYFDIKMDQGAKQALHVDLRNDTEKEVAVDVGIASATTNINGVVEYGQNAIKPARSLAFNMKDYVKTPAQVKIPAKGSTVLNLDVTMPSKPLHGVMAGGITLKEHQPGDQAAKDAGKGVAINNRFSYVIGLLMQQSTDQVAAHVKLNDVKPSQINYRNVILASMENDAATFVNKVAVDAKIMAKGSDKSVYQVAKEGLQMAPETTFDFPIALEGKTLKPGTYVAHLEVYGNQQADGGMTRKTADGKQHYHDHWTLTKQFTITDKVAKNLNQKDVSIKKDNSWQLYALITVVAVLIMIVALLLVIVFKRKKKEQAS